MAYSCILADDILGAVFDDESSSSGSDDEDGDDIYGYQGKPVLCHDNVEADTLALFEPSILGDTCIGDMFSDAVDEQIHGTHNQSDNSTEGESHGEALSRHSTLSEDIETRAHR